jgi:hypothetical protein
LKQETNFDKNKKNINMNPNTKFVQQLKKLSILIQKKIRVFQKNVIFSVFSLFLGFVCGNLFGTFLIFFRRFLNWDVLIITTTILIVEFINYLNYKDKKRVISKNFTWNATRWHQYFRSRKTKWRVEISKIFSTSQSRLSPLESKFFINETSCRNTSNSAFLDQKIYEIKKKINFIKILNFYKIGLLLGFFIDAFKVGS